VFRLAQTVPDGVRALMQAGGSPFDYAGRRPTHRIRMACKRSGVRIPIAPPQFTAIIRNPEPQSSGAWYSSKVPQLQRREVPYSHSDKAPPPMRPAGTALLRPGAETA
jgi:hypothetical protein